MTTTGPETNGNIEVYIRTREAWIADAVGMVTGDREKDPREVFGAPMQNPQEARAAQKPLELTAEKEIRLREIAGRFGIGGEADVQAQPIVKL